MKNTATISVLVLLAAAVQGLATGAPEEVPSAKELLSEVRARLPREPFTIVGRMWKGKYPRRASRCTAVEATLNFGSDPVTARYLITDSAGDRREQLAVSRAGRGGAEYAYSTGNPPASAPMPDLAASIQGTEISWLDLTLSYLWWDDGSIVDTDNVLGRDCYIVQLRIPPAEASYAGIVRLWIDCEYRLLLRARLYDAAGKPVRCLSVKSFKQIGEQWMVKDMEVRNEVTHSFTTLRIDEVTGPAVKEKPEDPGAEKETDNRLMLFPE